MRVGDIVWVYDVNASPRQRSVEKVGRVNFYLLHDRCPWDLVTRVQKDGGGHRSVVTIDEHQARLRKAMALKELRSINVDVRTHDPNVLEIHQLLRPLIERAAEHTKSKTGDT